MIFSEQPFKSNPKALWPTLSVLTLLLNTLFAISSHGNNVPRFAQKSLFIESQNEYLITSANYDKDGGSFESLGQGREYSRFISSNAIGYNFSPIWQIKGGGDFGFATSTDPTDTRKNSNLTRAFAGTSFKLNVGQFSFIPDLEFSYPIETFSDSTDNVLISDGSLSIKGGSWASFNYSRAHLSAYLGAEYRDKGLASLLHWKAGGEFRIQRFVLGGNVGGFTPIIDDENTNSQSKRKNITDKVNARSLAVYGVNPSVIRVEGQAKYLLKKQSHIYLGASSTINGSNYAHGINIFGGLRWSFGPFESNDDDDPQKTLEEFETLQQDYDESLFEPKKKKRKRNKKRKKKSQKDLLNEAEKMLDN